MSEVIAIVALTEQGALLARRLQARLPGAELHGLFGRVVHSDVHFEATGQHLRALFSDHRPIIGICASAILIRVLAPLLGTKRQEAPVLAIAEDGSCAVPLLGGHRGANQLATQIAEWLNGSAAITTATDRRLGIALDSPPAGWVLGNPNDCKVFAAALLAGDTVELEGQAPWLSNAAIEFHESGTLRISVAENALEGSSSHLVYHPRTLAVGVGCERDVDGEELISLARQTLAEANLSSHAVAAVYSLDLKADESAVHALAEALNVPVRFFDAASLEAEKDRLETPSETVFNAVGCHGVAEGAALAAVGNEGRLLVPKQRSRQATCSIAQAIMPIDPSATGRPRGRLWVVGLGPGTRALRTFQADKALHEAKHIVGYQGYLDLAGPPNPGQIYHPYDLGEEIARADEALRLAGSGEVVALVCSGDPGVYAMASLVFERLDLAADDRARRAEITVVPGVSAMHAAAARIGAPLGHDFCAISLSDLLTPWASIEKRLLAAAEADFVVALYNPASLRRREQLSTAIEIFTTARGSSTEVVLARQVGRPQEAISLHTLGSLDQSTVDMMSLLIIGSTQSRRVTSSGGSWLYTPRGYGPAQPEGRSA